MNLRAQTFSYSYFTIYLLAGLGSLLLSFWISGRESVINTDAICYLQSAETIGRSGIRDAMHLCGQARWPFYSLLIFIFSAISSLSYTSAAYILNAGFSCLTVIIFLAIIQHLGGSRRILWLAALVILAAHEVNSVKQYIIRDHGFWAFYLLSCYCLLRYFATYQRRYALCWNVSLLIATLFRVEGAFFLFLLPWMVWFYREPVAFGAQSTARPVGSVFRQLQSFIDLNALTIGVIAVLAAWLAFHPEQSLADWGRVQEIVSQFTHGGYLIWQRFHDAAINVSKYVLPSDSVQDASWVLFLVVIVWYIQNVVTNLSIVYTLLLIYAWWHAVPVLKKSARLVLYGYIFINVLVTAGFFLQHLFLSKRYLIALSILFMLWVPFVLDHLLKQYQAYTEVGIKRVFFPVIVLLIFVSSLGGIFDFGYSKRYIRDAGYWIALNIPKTAKLYSNDSQVMYYSKHFGSDIFNKSREYTELQSMARSGWKYYDFLAIRINKQEAISAELDILTKIPLMPVKVFTNKRGDQVRIYQVAQHTSG